MTFAAILILLELLDSTFHKGNPEAPTVFGALLLQPVVWFLLWSSCTQLEIAVSRSHVCITSLRRWLPPKVKRTYALDLVADAVVDTDLFNDDGHRRVALILSSGERAPLSGYCSGHAHHEAAALAIRTTLARARASES